MYIFEYTFNMYILWIYTYISHIRSWTHVFLHFRNTLCIFYILFSLLRRCLESHAQVVEFSQGQKLKESALPQKIPYGSQSWFEWSQLILPFAESQHNNTCIEAHFCSFLCWHLLCIKQLLYGNGILFSTLEPCPLPSLTWHWNKLLPQSIQGQEGPK